MKDLISKPEPLNDAESEQFLKKNTTRVVCATCNDYDSKKSWCNFWNEKTNPESYCIKWSEKKLEPNRNRRNIR